MKKGTDKSTDKSTDKGLNYQKIAGRFFICIPFFAIGFIIGAVAHKIIITNEVILVPALNETFASQSEPKTISYAPIECFINSTHINYSCVNK